MHFATPAALLLVLLVPLVWLTREGTPMMLKRREKTAALLFSTPASLANLSELGRTAERALALNILRTLCLVLVIIALARPQSVGSIAESEELGRDILLTLDLSGSMRALDFQLDGHRVDRLQALKSVVKDFIAERKGDRMGLVIFGSEVFTQCPLTTDISILQEFVSGLEIGMVGDGTAIGDALAVSVKRLKDIPGESRVIVLVTDGLKTAGTLEPEAGAKIAKQFGVKVYTIGIGGNKPAPFPAKGIFGEQRLTYLPVELDEKTLKAIAEQTGGKYFRAQETASLKEVYKEISMLEQRVDKGFQTISYKEHFLAFVTLALVCFLLHELLARTRYEVIP